MADEFRRVPSAAEMDVFEAEVSGEQNFVPTGDPEAGTVIANAKCYPWPNPALAADSGDKRFFSKRQNEINIQQGEATGGDCY